MAISPYIAALREHVGHTRLLLPSVTAIIYSETGSILLVRQRDGDVWSTPGGSIEPDEDPVDAVVRETWEETGLLVEPVGLIGVFGGPGFVVRYPNGDETQYVMAVYECTPVSGQLTGGSDEVSELRFVDRSEFESLHVPDWTHEVLPVCYSRHQRPVLKQPAWRPPDQL